MKKVLFFITALTLVLLSSCSNDDIEINTIGKRFNLTYNVAPQNMYDEFSMANDIREILRKEDYAIGITTFVYDSEGNFVNQLSNHQYTFNNISQNFEGLVEGSYTLVTIETLATPSDDNLKMRNWAFNGIEKLSSLEIIQKYNEVLFPFVLGVCTTNVTITGDQTINVTPKAIGSLLQLTYVNFDKSVYPSVGFGTDDIITSYKLDPNLSRSDKFYTELTEVDKFILRCKSAVDGKDYIHQTRYILEDYIKYSFRFQEKENEETDTWTYYYANESSTTLEDGKVYYAGSCYVNENKPFQTYFGDEEGFIAWYNALSISGGDDSLIPNIYLSWGGSVANVQSSMNGYTMTLGSEGRAVLQDDGSYEINYTGKGKENKISYSFTSATTGLFEVDVQYEKTNVTQQEILAYLNANYMYLADAEGSYMYCTSDFKTYVLFFEINGVWDIGFVDASYLANAGVKAKYPTVKLNRSKAKTNNKVQQTAIMQNTNNDTLIKFFDKK